MTLPHIDSIGFTTADAEVTAGFFAECLGFQRSGEPLLVDGGPYAELVGLPGARFKLLRLLIGMTAVARLLIGIREQETGAGYADTLADLGQRIQELFPAH